MNETEEELMQDQQLVINNLEEKMKLFTNAVNGHFLKEEDFALANTGIPTDTFNILLPKTAQIKNASIIRGYIENMMLNNFPFSTWLDARYLNSSWKKLLSEYDLHEAERNIMMKLENTLQIDARKSYKVKINAVQSLEDLNEYKEVFFSLFEGSSEAKALEAYFSKFSAKDIATKATMFIGQVNEITVSTGLLIDSPASYGIYDVMTREIFRGKGYGSEMFQHLLAQTKDKQKPVVLQASDDGKAIYERCGFKVIGEMVVFE